VNSAAEIIRVTDIGASEVAAICGVSPFADAWSVLRRKKGLGEPEPETEEMRWGKILEPIIAGVFAHRSNLAVGWWDRPVYSKKRDWQRASPDGLILSDVPLTFLFEKDSPELVRRMIEEGRCIGVLECKTTGPHYANQWGPSGTGAQGIPEWVLLQVQTQMSTLELGHAWVACLISGQDFRQYHIEDDPYLWEVILEEVEPFYFQCVLGDKEPPISSSKHVRNYIRERYPKNVEKLRPATEKEAGWLAEYASVRARMDELEDQRDLLEHQLTHAIAEAEGIESPRIKMTWKRTRDGSETSWEELAREQLVGYSDEERNGIIQQYTHPVPGYRKIHFKDYSHAKPRQT